ncbi:MAG TPA: transglycosylase domain-containing protein [Chloroflexota bacterium]|jgi:membrane peptidoglycan carboxypeptidase|nr:transglycosylase domain-containing protein [Chloroflexota bacterium]
MQRFSNGNGDGNGRDLSRNANGHALDIRRRAQQRAQDRLQRLYRIQAARQYRERSGTSNRVSKPLMVGSGLLVAMIGVGLLGIFVLLQGAATGYAMLTRDLPSLSQISNHASFKTAQIFDRKGTLLWEFYDPDGGKRTVIPLSEISQNLIDASLAAEDAFFYQHRGVDLRATIRSALLTGSGTSQTGASTITQQLVRNVILSPEERKQITLNRKAREIILAYQLDEKLSKDEILEMYLNEVYYGNQSYGVEAAAQSYFDKHARDLDIAEAALIAGLVQSPSQYDPTRRDVDRTSDGIPIVTKERQGYVLEQMTRHGFITEQQALEAYAEQLQIKTHQVELKAPHWVMYIRDLVEQKYGARTLYQGGLKIYTTLDLEYNDKMSQVLQDAKSTIATQGATNAAQIAVNPKTGEILAFNGSLDYNDESIDGQVNLLTSERQPGSSIKPVIYATSFLKGNAPATVVDDNPTCWKDTPTHQWCPGNFDNIFHGQTTVRSALGNSLNIPAVKTLDFVGVDNAIEQGNKLGVTTWAPDSGKTFGLSLTLGGAETKPIDMAQVYATFANNGLKIPLVAVTRIVDAEGNVIEDYKVPQGEQVIDPRAAYMISNILSDPAAKLFTYGPNTPLMLHQTDDPKSPLWPAASKTGTTDNYRDTWTDGYTPSMAIVVWVGNADGHPMHQTLSTLTAAKIWPASMKLSFDYFHMQAEDFPRPAGLVERQVCGDTRMRPGAPLCWNDLFFAESAPKGTVQAGPRPAAVPSGTPAATPGAAAQPTAPVAPAQQPAPAARPTQAAAPAQQQPPAPQPAPQQPAPTQQQAPAAQPTVAPPPAPPKPQVQPPAAPPAPATKPQPTPRPAR